MFYVYIIQRKDNKLYAGSTSNLKRRLLEHQRGKVKSTRNQRPIKLVFYEAYLLKSDAQRRERFLKSTEGKRLLRQQLKDFLYLIDGVHPVIRRGALSNDRANPLRGHY